MMTQICCEHFQAHAPMRSVTVNDAVPPAGFCQNFGHPLPQSALFFWIRSWPAPVMRSPGWQLVSVLEEDYGSRGAIERTAFLGIPALLQLVLHDKAKNTRSVKHCREIS
jgi:hypothetical protein